MGRMAIGTGIVRGVVLLPLTKEAKEVKGIGTEVVLLVVPGIVIGND